ncbi:MAG: hypothetical protein ACLUIQ_03410 [Dialister invisus]
MPKERFKSVAAGILGYTHDKASIKTINIDMAGHDLTLDLTKVADLGLIIQHTGSRRIIRQLSWLTAIKPIREKRYDYHQGENAVVSLRRQRQQLYCCTWYRSGQF